MNLTKYAAFVLTALVASYTTAAHSEQQYSSSSKSRALTIPADSALPAIKISSGDEVEIASSTLFDDEYFVTVHCANESGPCTENEVVSVFHRNQCVWTKRPDRCASSHDVRVTRGARLYLRHEGRYLFLVVKNSLCSTISNLNCRWDGFLHYGDPQVLPISEVKRSENDVRVSYGPTHWINLRFVLANKTSVPSAAGIDGAKAELGMVSEP